MVILYVYRSADVRRRSTGYCAVHHGDPILQWQCSTLPHEESPSASVESHSGKSPPANATDGAFISTSSGAYDIAAAAPALPRGPSGLGVCLGSRRSGV